MRVVPIYEYQCRQCGRRFEVLQRMGAGPKGLSCPDCGDRQVDKQFSTFASGDSGDGRSSAASAVDAGCGSGSGFR